MRANTRAAFRRYPALVALLALTGVFWTRNTLPFVAEDCYFYAIIARNIALRGVQSFWGVEPTNGVHPLWVLLLGGYSWIVSLFSTDALYHAVYGVPLSLALLGGGAINWMYVADQARLPRSVLVFPQLVYLSVFGLVYSEAHLSFFALSWLGRLACTDEDRQPRPILVGLAAAAVFLARLDNMFYVGAFVLWYCVRRRSLRTTAILVATIAVPAFVYLVVNVVYFGGLTPVSGFLKSTFPTPFIQGLRFVGGPAIMLSGYSVPFGWVPIALGCATALALRRSLTGPQTLLYPLLCGTVCHAVYTGFFTAGFTDWYWYYVLPIALLSWSMACSVRTFWNATWDNLAQWVAVGVLAVALFGARLHPPTEVELPALTTLRVVRELGIDRSVLLVSEWPGTLAFYSHSEVIGADMLTSNRVLLKQMTDSSNAMPVLFDEARRKGTPIEYVLYNGGIFFAPSADLQDITYMDPKMVNNVRHHVIGHVHLGPPIATRDGIIVWKAPVS